MHIPLIIGSNYAIPNHQVGPGVTLVTSSSPESTENCGLGNQRYEMSFPVRGEAIKGKDSIWNTDISLLDHVTSL